MSIQQVQATGPDRVRAMLEFFGLSVAAASGILPAGPVLPAPLLVDEPTYRDCLRDLNQRLATFAVIGCPIATIVLNPRSTLPRVEAEATAIRRLTELTAAGAEHGVRLAVETIGVHRGLDASLDGPNPVADTLPQTATCCDRCPGTPWRWSTPSTGPPAAPTPTTSPASVPAPSAMSTSPTPPGCVTPPLLADAMRLFPGEGSLPWPVFADALRRGRLHRCGVGGAVQPRPACPARPGDRPPCPPRRVNLLASEEDDR